MRARACARSENINHDKKEQPDNVDKVPVPRRRLEPEMALRGEVSCQRAQQANQQKHRADNDVKTVKSGRHEKGCAINMTRKTKRGVLIFVNLKNREQSAQSHGEH